MDGYLTVMFICWLIGAPAWLRNHLLDLESEIRGVPVDYDFRLEVWSLEERVPQGMRVGYLPFDGNHRVGYVEAD